MDHFSQAFVIQSDPLYSLHTVRNDHLNFSSFSQILLILLSTLLHIDFDLRSWVHLTRQSLKHILSVAYQMKLFAAHNVSADGVMMVHCRSQVPHKTNEHSPTTPTQCYLHYDLYKALWIKFISILKINHYIKIFSVIYWIRSLIRNEIIYKKTSPP